MGLLVLASNVSYILGLTVGLTCLIEDAATECDPNHSKYFCCGIYEQEPGLPEGVGRSCYRISKPKEPISTTTTTVTETAISTTTTTTTTTTTASPPPVTTDQCAANKKGFCCAPDQTNCAACKLAERPDEQS